MRRLRCRLPELAVVAFGPCAAHASTPFHGEPGRHHACPSSTIPAVSLVYELDGCPVDIDPLSCGDFVALDDGSFHFTGRYAVANLGELHWSVRVHEDPFVIANVTASNNTAVTQTYSITVAVPVPPLAPAVVGGSISGTVSDGNRNGALLSAPGGGGSIYTALLDNVGIQQLLTDPLTIAVPRFETAAVGPASFGDPIPSLCFPGVSNSIGATLSFTLTAGDSTSLTSIFVVEEGTPWCPPSPAPPDAAAVEMLP